ncbi:MAG: ribonuclease PH [Clostridia bacterium]|nr:ribonuclease PH [Clostridia bacterium]
MEITRKPDEMRQIKITPDFTEMAAGSVLIECGRTRVLCTASVVENVPPFKKGSGQGWLTAEYAMLPGSTNRRKERDGLKKDGRGIEIQRLIGRSLRAACDLTRLGERTIYIDCDVLQADGGTRTASITGAFAALTIACDKLLSQGLIVDSPVVRQLAAVSVGIVDDVPTLDLEYIQDSRAQVDMNVIMTKEKDGSMRYVEVQGTGEGRAFDKAEMDKLLALAKKGIQKLMKKQISALGKRAEVIGKKPKLVVATRNFGKIRELKALLGDKFDVSSMAEAGVNDDVEETGETFAENALIKAEALNKALGCAALADDSGLIVDALGGAPGVYSARYSGVHGDDEANNVKLLDALRDVPAPRTARFACAIALVRPGREKLIVEGTSEGKIAFEKKGEGGFGYDPLFECNQLNGKTFAQAGDEEKNLVSHRANAIRALVRALEAEK